MEYLNFEKPIEELTLKISQAKELAEDGVDVKKTVRDLENKLKIQKETIYSNLSAWQKVQLSRHPQRPYTLDYIENITENFIELHGDRNVKDDKAMVGGWGSIEGKSYMIIGQQKGKNRSHHHPLPNYLHLSDRFAKR